MGSDLMISAGSWKGLGDAKGEGSLLWLSPWPLIGVREFMAPALISGRASVARFLSRRNGVCLLSRTRRTRVWRAEKALAGGVPKFAWRESLKDMAGDLIDNLVSQDERQE